MKKLYFFALTLIMTASIYPQMTIRLTNGEWPPYMGENIREKGLISHIVKEAFALEGYEVEYGFFPWKRGYQIAKSGEWDGTVGWKKNTEREMDFYFSDTIIVMKEVFFHRKDVEFDWVIIEDLKKYKIGTAFGYIYGTEFESFKSELTIEETADDLGNLKKLLGKRIDIFPCNLEVGYLLIKQNFKNHDIKIFTHHPKPINTGRYSLLISKNIRTGRK